jgi:hypothetical protein
MHDRPDVNKRAITTLEEFLTESVYPWCANSITNPIA